MITSVTKAKYENNTTATTHNLPYPADIQAGDTLVLFFSMYGNYTATLPAGWTKHVDSNYKGVFATKTADGSESGTYAVTLGGTRNIIAFTYRVRSDNPLMMYVNHQQFGGGTTFTMPDYVLRNWQPVETLLFCVGLRQGPGSVTSYPTGFTDTDYGTSTNYGSVGASYRISTLNELIDPSYTFSSSYTTEGVTVAFYEFEVQSITPNSIQVDEYGSARIKVVGDVSGGAVAYLDTDPITIVTIEDAQTLFVQIPSQATYEILDVRVVPTIGGHDDTLANAFTYLYRAPIIDSVTPAGGQVGIGGSITIKGHYFRSGLTVEIDGVACTSIVVVDSETITCNYPIGTIQESVILIVENDDTQADFANFTYMAQVPAPSPEPSVTATFSIKAVQYQE